MYLPVRWVWVKSHSQVDGNEAADAGATKGKTGNQTAIQPQETLDAHDEWRKRNALALTSAQEQLRVAQEAGDPFEINDATQQAARAEQQNSVRSLNAKTAAQATAAAAKDSMVRCKNIDERIKQFVKRANENADPAGWVWSHWTTSVHGRDIAVAHAAQAYQELKPMGGVRATPSSSAGLVRRVPSRSSATRRAAMANASCKIDDARGVA